jgi:hypothetical protein
MRAAFSVLFAVLVLFPHNARADAISFQFLNSDVYFGPSGAVHYGRDGEVWRGGLRVFVDAWFSTELLEAADQQLLTTPTGTVVQSNYFYPDSTFHFGFEFSPFESGGFDLPLTSYGLYVPEPPYTHPLEPGPLLDDSGGDVYFTLGRGVLDPALARRLRVGRRILGGFGGSDMSYANCGELGNHLSEERHACDGATWITLEVPEPSALALMSTGAVAMVVGRRRRRRRKGVAAKAPARPSRNTTIVERRRNWGAGAG